MGNRLYFEHTKKYISSDWSACQSDDWIAGITDFPISLAGNQHPG